MINVLEKCKVENTTKDILSLCKKVIKEKVKFTELGRDMFKDNPKILKKYFRNAEGQDCYYANLLCFKDIEDITLYQIKNTLKYDFKMDISLAGYKYNPEHYRFATCQLQNDYDEDLFRDNSDREEELKESLDTDFFNRRIPLDYEALEELYVIFMIAIEKRLVMLLHLENVPGIINNALDCNIQGVSNIPSNNAIRSKLNEVKWLLAGNKYINKTDKEIKELLDNGLITETQLEIAKWLSTGVSDLSNLQIITNVSEVRYIPIVIFDGKPIKYQKIRETNPVILDLRNDYIETYQKVLRQFTGIRNEPLEYCREVLEQNTEDLWIEEIIANDIPDEEQLYDSDSDENEFLTNNELFD